MTKQVEKKLSAEIKVAESETPPNVPTDNQARAYIMSLIKDTKAEMAPAKPIPKKVNLKSILVKIKTSPK